MGTSRSALRSASKTIGLVQKSILSTRTATDLRGPCGCLDMDLISYLLGTIRCTWESLTAEPASGQRFT